MSTILALSPVLSPIALADGREVSVDNHTSASTTKQTVSSVQISEVNAPMSGMMLDDEATVTTAEHATWQIPVLWVSDDPQVVSDEALEGHAYVPILAFFVPQEFALEGDTFAVSPSNEHTELFGTDEIVSVYDSRTGITYILPASLVRLFARADGIERNPTGANELEASVEAEQGQDQQTTNYGLGKPNRAYDANTLFDNYTYGMKNKNTFAYFDLEYHNTYTDDADNSINSNYSRYTSGYLATLYLSDLAARHNNDGASAIRVDDDGTTTVDATQLRMGLDSLMRWMHEGQTMDELVGSLSPTDENDQPIYKDTDDLTKKFIKGEKNDEGEYVGDEESLTFTVAYLKNLRKIEEELPKEDDPDGSILQDFDVNYKSMLGPSQEATTPVLNITESNSLVESSVASDQAAIGGGKSPIEPGSEPVTQGDAQEKAAPSGK